MKSIPLPPSHYQAWFELEFRQPLTEYWLADGLDLDRFMLNMLGQQVPEEQLLDAIINKYGARAARLIRHLEEYLLVQHAFVLGGRLN